MIEHTSDEVAYYYYDSHPTEEDLMGETLPHADLVDYLKEVLAWLFRGRACAIYKNFNFYQTPDKHEKPLAPDLAVIKGITQRPVRSWRVGVHGPAPHVVFEIASEETWTRDLLEKPDRYALMGVQEYFAWNRARWSMWQQLRARGVALERIDGGTEAWSFYELANADRKKAVRGHPPRDFLIAFHRVPGYHIVQATPFEGFLGLRRWNVYVLQKD